MKLKAIPAYQKNFKRCQYTKDAKNEKKDIVEVECSRKPDYIAIRAYSAACDNHVMYEDGHGAEATTVEFLVKASDFRKFLKKAIKVFPEQEEKPTKLQAHN